MTRRNSFQLERRLGRFFLVAWLPSFTICLALGALTGCNQGPSRVGMLDYDAGGSADRALEQFDSDGNGSLSKSELEKCPGILAALDRFDSDGDGEVSGDEIEERIQNWSERKSASLGITVKVSMDGKPLDKAVVELTPATYMELDELCAKGTTDPTGKARMKIDKAKSSDSLHSLPGIPPGLYSIRITHPEKTIPAKYNSATELGAEVAYEMTVGAIHLELKSR